MVIKVFGLGFLFCLTFAMLLLIVDFKGWFKNLNITDIAIGVIIVAGICEVVTLIAMIVYVVKQIASVFGV